MDEVPRETLAEDEDEQKQKRKQSWLTLALVLVVFIVVLLLWRYCVPSATETDETEATVATAVVPDVVGLDEAEAIAAVDEVGLLAESNPVFDTSVDSGIVVFQSPQAGFEAQMGAIVAIDVATDFGIGGSAPGDEDGYLLVPDVVGKQEADAIYTIESAGFVSSSRRGNKEPYQKDAVYDQIPSAGSSAPFGSQVVIYVSTGPSSPGNVTVPDTIGLAESAAVSRVQAAGLSPQVLRRPQPGSVGDVYDQFPFGGDVVPSGSQVHILIGTAR